MIDTYDMFACKVYQEHIDNKTTMSSLLSYCANVARETKNDSISNRIGFQSHKQLHLDDVMLPLNEYICNTFNSIISQRTDKKYSVEVDSMWINMNKKYGFNHVHTHTNCWYSGILFVDWLENSGNLVFLNPSPGYVQNSDELSLDINVNKAFCPVPGSLILFPAWLPHLVEPNQNDRPAICIAFNVRLKR